MDSIVSTSAIAPALILLAVYVLSRHVLYPTLFSPLAKIPNAHPLAALTSGWITWIRFTETENKTLRAAHQRHGSVIRLGPSELSVSCMDDGIKTVYGKGFDKPPFYSIFVNFGIRNTFSSLQSDLHTIKRKRISNIYSKSHLQTSSDLRAILQHVFHKRLLPQITDLATTASPVNVFLLHQAATMDITTAYFFGLPVGTNFVEDHDGHERWLEQYSQSRPREAMFFLQEVPRLTAWLGGIGFDVISKCWASKSNNDQVDTWCLSLCDAAEDLLASAADGAERVPGQFPVVYDQLKKTTIKQGVSEKPSIRQDSITVEQNGHKTGETLSAVRSPQQLEVASELMDQVVASHEGFRAALLDVSYELSIHPQMQTRLRETLRSIPEPLLFPSDENQIPDAKTLNELPLLNAILMETMRLYPPISGGQPRLTPPNSSTRLGKYYDIPPNTRVSASASTVHRNPDVFPDPDTWQPERWLDGQDDGGEKEKWFWAFSSGPRMCLGQHFAIQVMKYVIAAIYTNFTSHVVDAQGHEQIDGYVSGPKGGKLVLKFQSIPI